MTLIAHLVTPIDDDGSEGAIYAVLCDSRDSALTQVACALGMEMAEVAYAGTLSHEMAIHFGLKPGEVHRI